MDTDDGDAGAAAAAAVQRDAAADTATDEDLKCLEAELQKGLEGLGADAGDKLEAAKRVAALAAKVENVKRRRTAA